MKTFMKFLAGFLGSFFKKGPITEKVPKVKKPAKPVQEPFEVIDYVNVLKWHKSRTWSKRTLSKINKLVVHQSLTSGSLEGINNYHITPGKQNHISPKGAPHICYHYAVDKDGKVYQCNQHSSLVWHTRGQNTTGIGIVLLGNFDGPTYKGTETPTSLQLENTNRLIDFLLKSKDINIEKTEVYGHKDFGKENCPGTIVYDSVVKLRREGK